MKDLYLCLSCRMEVRTGLSFESMLAVSCMKDLYLLLVLEDVVKDRVVL